MSDSEDVPAKIEYSELSFSPLTADTVIPESFDCGSGTMNEFILTDEAREYEKELLGKTTLVHLGPHLVAYYTLSNDAFRLKDLQGLKIGSPLDDLPVGVIPAVFVGRLAVDKKWKRRGIGSHIIHEALSYAAECASKRCAIRLLMLHAKKDAVGFYERLEFKRTPESPIEASRFSGQGLRTMYLDLKTIIDTDTI